MKVSVLMPTHNAARTIRAALESVFRQTSPPHEILVLDDGSTDGTVPILQSYGSRIKLLLQENTGVAYTRNRLCHEASGDLLAFLDHDDLWHPAYLAVQQRHFSCHPEVAALFTGQTVFYGYGDYDWSASPPGDDRPVELIESASFLTRYNQGGTFGCASFMCVPKSVLARLGEEPFKVDAAEDAYFCTWLPLLGPVGYSDAPLVAYRITQGATSTDQFKAVEARIDVLELMEPHYKSLGAGKRWKLFQSVFASKRRQYAKHLMGAGRRAEAREQLCLSLTRSKQLASMAKSIGLLTASYMPAALQPGWPSAQRDWRDPRSR